MSHRPPTTGPGPLRVRFAPRFETCTGARAFASGEDFDDLTQSGRPVPGGRSEQRLLESEDWPAPLRLRSSRRGGTLGPLLRDRYARPEGILREFDVWTELAMRGVPTPRIAFAAARRRGCFWQTCLASVERPSARDGLRLMDEEDDAFALESAARAVGVTLRRLHDCGYTHGDLHLRNLLFEETRSEIEGGPRHLAKSKSAQRVCSCLLIDFDRARKHAPISPRDRLSDWLRLIRSTEKAGQANRISKRVLAAALAAYCDGDRGLRRALLSSAPSLGSAFWRHRLAWRLRSPMSALALALPLLFSNALSGCSPPSEAAPDPQALAPLDAPRLSLLVVGDTGRDRFLAPLFEGQRSVARGMTEEASANPVDGVVLLGDNFYWNGLARENLIDRLKTNIVLPYCHFLRLDGPRSSEVEGACDLDIASRRPVPIYAVLGNHDIENPESVELQRSVVRDFVPGWRMSRGLAEVFELGNGISLVLFESEPAIDDPDEIEHALRHEIRRARGPWIVLATHRPIATDDYGAPRLGGYPHFVRSAIEAEGRPVQLVLAAHHHNIQAFEVGEPVPSLQLGLGSGARAEPPLATADHPDIRFSRLALGFGRIDLVGTGEEERLVATLFESPPWPALLPFVETKPIARFSVDRAGRVTQVHPPAAN